MSREIKFRAWDKKHRKYAKILKVYFGSDGSNLGALIEDYETNYAFELQANQVEFEQYTGLKDKNGKEIYEGDVLRFKMHTGEYENYEIVFRDVTFEAINADGTNFISYSIWNIGEVVGNIHENPELL